MEVIATINWKVCKNGTSVKIYTKGKIYHAEKSGFENGYSVTDENGQENLFCDDLFHRIFKLVKA